MMRSRVSFSALIVLALLIATSSVLSNGQETNVVTATDATGPAAHAIVKYTVPGSGKGEGQGTEGGGIVNDGSIVGFYTDSAGISHGYLRASGGKLTKFDAPDSQSTFPIGMNQGLAITGYYSDSNGILHGFLRSSAGIFTKFDVPGAGDGSGQGTIAENINTGGEIAGYYYDSNGATHGFLRTAKGKFTKFDVPGAGTGPNQGTAPTSFSGLTDAGVIAGNYTDSNQISHGFLRFADGKIARKIDPKGSQLTIVFAMNSKNTIAGSYIDSTGFHGFLRTSDGTITSFDAPNSIGTSPTNINSAGVAAGTYSDPSGLNHGFTRSADGTIVEFSVSGASQGTFPYANNASGEISGTYIDSNGAYHGFLRH
jgi:hypothetical protein